MKKMNNRKKSFSLIKKLFTNDVDADCNKEKGLI